ncbi:MAG: hypothetical protein IKP66_04610 [Lachnospiraceae bacterium]|nr:hypothetical protein [Lachnospiraceae bacterium]
MAENYVFDTIVYLKHPMRVEISQWSVEHKGCNALVLPTSDINYMSVVFYAKTAEGNEGLNKILETQPKLRLFRNSPYGITD